MPFIINGETIDASLLDAEFGRIKADFEQRSNVSCCDRDDEFMGYAKDNISASVLLSQHAEQTIPTPDIADIDAHIEKLIQEHGNEDALYFNLGIAPGEKSELGMRIATSIQVERLVSQIVGDPPDTGERQLADYYQKHQADFMSAEEVRSMHIFKSLRMAEDREILFRELRAVREEALAGADFADLARQHSDKPEEDIDLGWYRRGELMEEFELVTFSMQLGEVSPVFATQWGMHLAKLCERREPQPQPIADVADQIRERITSENHDSKLEAHIDALRAKAEIVDTEGQ